MKKFLNLILFLNCLILSDLEAKISTIHSIRDVIKYLSPKTSRIVVFDIDNTLLRAPTDLGSDQWVSFIVKQKVAEGMSHSDAWNQILPTYFHIQRHINLVPTEPDIVDSVGEIEQMCDHTICLTARCPIHLTTITCAQLIKNNLKFQVPEVNHTQLTLPGDSIYQDGVLFCGHSCKGEVLVNFLRACRYMPKEIILIDDKLYNLEAVEKQLANHGIQFTGLRYAGCDALILSLDMVKAKQDLDELLLQYPL